MPCSWEILWCRRTSNGESLTGTTNSTWGQRPRKTWPCQVNWTLLTCDIMWPTCILGTFREDPQYPNSSRHLSVLLALQCFASWTRVPSNSWYIIYNGIYIYIHITHFQLAAVQIVQMKHLATPQGQECHSVQPASLQINSGHAYSAGYLIVELYELLELLLFGKAR